ncbi:hypothetical protein [Rodentibacter caecimuris]|uniref:hypothetical protein n=1 Tax=Rodentibacter caecimuris TaxID=1796644 RepID=UPI002119D8DB|nr:hypothetical protein [Rodentibacter heylii]MCQ9124718.1 hypothetical protein [Rodentibacter heylii]MCX2962292.1 hypothetical protein [Rodentibacter heylii]
MALNKRSITEKDTEKLAEQLADKPYGKDKLNDETMVRTSFALPKALLNALEDEALANKRTGIEPKSVSEIIRRALENRNNNS